MDEKLKEAAMSALGQIEDEAGQLGKAAEIAHALHEAAGMADVAALRTVVDALATELWVLNAARGRIEKLARELAEELDAEDAEE